MSDAEIAKEVIADLAGRKPGAQVSVLVRPQQRSDKPELPPVDPKSFSSAGAYRSALIAHQKEAVRPEKDAVVTEALSLGLDASAAGALNAVLVHGSAGAVLQLLDRINYSSVNLDSQLKL